MVYNIWAFTCNDQLPSRAPIILYVCCLFPAGAPAALLGICVQHGFAFDVTRHLSGVPQSAEL
jgi:hypothetical protein